MDTIYKGYEIFHDPSYYDLIACRKEGVTSWSETMHFDTVVEAKASIDFEIINNGGM